MQVAELPVADRLATARWPGSKRRTKPSMIGSAVPRMRSAHRLTRARLRSIGFSQSTGLPAATAASSRSACVGVELAIRTASTSGLAKTASADSKTGAPALRRRPAAGVGDVVDAGERGSRVRGDVLGVHAADPAAAEDGDSNHRFLPEKFCNVCCVRLVLSIHIS